MPDPTAALRAWLDQTLEESPVGTRLPNRSELAKRFHLARATVNRVFARYGKRIAAHPGKGSCVGSFPHPQELARIDPLRISDRILERLWTGELQRGERLPPLKVLAPELGVSQRALGRACRSLVKRGVLTISGRGLRVGGLTRDGKRQSSHVILVYPDTDADQAFGNQLQQQALSALEDELARHQVALKLVPRTTFLTNTLRLWESGAERSDTGVLFAGVEIGEEALVADVARRLARLRPKPALLLCGRRLNAIPEGANMFCVGTIPTRRLRRTAELAAQSGCTNIHLLLAAENAWKGRLLAEYVRFLPEILARNNHSSFIIHLERCAFWRTPAQAIEDLTRRHGFPRAYLQGLLDKFGTNRLEDFPDRIRINEDPVADCAKLEQALVVVDGEQAAIALHDRLRHRRRSVPGSVQILCLNHGVSLRQHGIATLLPDWEGIAILMAQSLLQGITPPRTQRGYLAIPTRYLPRTTMSV